MLTITAATTDREIESATKAQLAATLQCKILPHYTKPVLVEFVKSMRQYYRNQAAKKAAR